MSGLRLVKNSKLLVKDGFLVLRIAQEKATIMVAFCILRHWFFYGTPNQEELRQIFKTCCAEQQREIIIALKNHSREEERRLAEKLDKKLSSFPEKENYPLRVARV